MKKFLALLLALTLALSLAVPAYAADTAEDEDFDWAALEAELAKAEAEQRAAALKELGAAAGQINILLNDKCVAFPDAVPVLKGGRTMVPMRAAVEAMGAVVDYDAATRTASVKMGDVSFTHVIGTDVITLSDGSTVKMDIVSYIDKGRTMVPLRFFSQVLGYDVFWDNDYKLAFLMGEDTWAAAVDKDLTILNSLLAQQSKSADLSKTQKSTLTAKGAVKVVDSINGDKSYPYSGSMTVLAGKDAANLTMSLDLSSMLELLESLVEDSIPAEYRAQLAKFSAEAIFSDKAYIKSPLLDAMSESKSGTWYALGELNYSELYQQAISAASASASATTFGHLLYAMMQQGEPLLCFLGRLHRRRTAHQADVRRQHVCQVRQRISVALRPCRARQADEQHGQRDELHRRLAQERRPDRFRARHDRTGRVRDARVQDGDGR